MSASAMGGSFPESTTSRRARWARSVRFSTLGATLLTGSLLTLWTALLNGWPLGLAPGVLAFWLVLLYTPFFLALHIVLALGLRLAQRPWPEPAFVHGTTLAAIVCLNALMRFHTAGQWLAPDAHLHLIGVLSAISLLVLAVLVVYGVAHTKVWPFALALVVFVGLHRLALWHERPEVDQHEAVAKILEHSSVPPPSAPPDESILLSETSLVVLGFDGLAWPQLVPLLEDGKLPAFRSLLEEAAYGELQTFPDARPRTPTLYDRLTWTESISPIVWETLATGRSPADHGIGYHHSLSLPGLGPRIQHLPAFYRGHSPMALRHLLTAATRVLPGFRLTGNSGKEPRAARFFDVAERAGMSVGLYDGVNTGPVFPVRGFMQGRSPRSPRLHPPEVAERLPPLPRADLVAPHTDEEVERRLRFEEARVQRFLTLAQLRPAQVLLYYTHALDAIHHAHWRREAVEDRWFFLGLERREHRPGPASTRALQHLDRFLGQLLRRLGEKATVLVISDHGFDWRGYRHHNGPPALLIARGPGIRTGPFPTATIFDFAPTLLHLLDLPVAEDIEGGLIDLFTPGGSHDHPPREVPSHGKATPPLPEESFDLDSLEAEAELLRSLGYVN